MGVKVIVCVNDPAGLPSGAKTSTMAVPLIRSPDLSSVSKEAQLGTALVRARLDVVSNADGGYGEPPTPDMGPGTMCRREHRERQVGNPVGGKRHEYPRSIVDRALPTADDRLPLIVGITDAALFGNLRRVRHRCEGGDHAAHQQDPEDSLHHTVRSSRSALASAEPLLK